MTWGITSPVTGGAQTGLTSPTYTLVDDIAPDVNARQKAVSALGGTQTGVSIHSIATPFTIAFWRPKIFKILGKTNPVTGLLPAVPMNTFKVVTRKGVLPLAGQPTKPMVITTVVEIPAGADTADPANVRAALSLHLGGVWQQSAGVGDTVISGIV